MRRRTAVLGVMAIVVFAAGPARGQSYTLPYSKGDASFAVTNEMNAFSSLPSQQANWKNPFAATRGAIWINTGSGPVMATAAVNLELWVNDYDNEWGSGGDGTGGADGWLLEQRLLLSDGGANNDMPQANGPGIFSGASELGVPGTYWQDLDGDEQDTRFQFHLYAWTGSETTYGAALAAGERTADAVWTQNVGPAYCESLGQMPPVASDLNNAAMILESLPGDANRDGKVDINDLTIVLTNFGLSGSPLDVTYSQGDFNGDGKIDINDLTIVLTHFGQSIGSSAAGMAPAPEPGSLAVVAAGLAGLLAYAWRKLGSGQGV